MDADALAARLTEAASDRGETPCDEDMLDGFIHHAYEYHDTLVEMGGRPTRKVLDKPEGKAIYGDDEIRLVDSDGELQCTVALDANLTLHHWTEECARFEEELDQWKEFRKFQQVMEHQHLSNIPFDPKNTDQSLMKILVRLNDWREFQRYQQIKVGEALMLSWRSTRRVANLMSKEDTSSEPTSNIETQNELAAALRKLHSLPLGLETSRMQLTWIENQILEILAEACALLKGDSSLQGQLEMKLELQANSLIQELKDLKATPVPSMRVPLKSADFAQRVCHWGSEITRLMQEHWEWKIFLRWRKDQPTAETTANTREQGSSGRSSELEIWEDIVSYRRYQLDRARKWVAGWQRLQKLRENDKQHVARQQYVSGFEIFLLESSISNVREYVEKFQQDVHAAEFQLQWAEQKLSNVSSQRYSPAPVQVTHHIDEHPQLPLSQPASESSDRVCENSSLVRSRHPPTEVRQRATQSPSDGISDSIQLTNTPGREKERRQNGNSTNKGEPLGPLGIHLSDQVIAGNDIHMTDGREYSYQDKVFKIDEGAELTDTPKRDVDDILMTDVKGSVDMSSRITSEIDFEDRQSKLSRSSSLPTHRVSTSRKTRSATKLSRTTTSRVLKNAVKKPGFKAKSLTEQEITALLDATLVEGSCTDSPRVRRSQRLKEQAAAPSLDSPPESTSI